MVREPVAGRIGELQLHLLLTQLRAQLVHLLVHHAQDHLAGQAGEGDPAVQAVAELGAEGTLDGRLGRAAALAAVDGE